MATGYDQRQPTRGSFAGTQAPQPVQRQSLANGQSRGAQITGVGQGGWGGVAAGRQTDPGDIAGGLGQLVERIMQPYVEARQQEQFFKGFTDAEGGRAVAEAKQTGVLSKIFGPTGYEQGAVAYTAVAKNAEFNSYILDNKEELAKLPREERGRLLADKSKSLMTGNPFADRLIQSNLVEMAQPTMNTLEKASFAWQQVEGVRAQASAGEGGADVFEKTAQAQMTLGERADTSAIVQAGNNLLATMRKPAGMEDSAHRAMFSSFIRNQVAKGNFRTVEMFRQAGWLNSGGLLNDDQLASLETYQSTQASKKWADLKIADPSLAVQYAAIEEGIDAGKITTPKQVLDLVGKANLSAAGSAGIPVAVAPLIGATAQEALLGRLNSEKKSANLRVEQRAYEQQKRDEQRKYDANQKLLDAQQKIQLAALMGANGSLGRAIAQGVVDHDSATTVMTQALDTGNYDFIVKQVAEGPNTMSILSPLITGGFEASVGVGPTPAFERSMARFSGLYKVNKGAALLAADKHGPDALAYMEAINAKVPAAAAYQASFGRPHEFSDNYLPAGVTKKDAMAYAVKAVTHPDKWLLGLLGERVPLSGASRTMMAESIYQDAAAYSKRSGLDFEEATKAVAGQYEKSGRWERMGSVAWRNQPGSASLSGLVGVPPDTGDRLFNAVLDRKLKASGFAAGASSDNLTGFRTEDHGMPYVMVQASDAGNPVWVAISLDDLKAERRAPTKKPGYSVGKSRAGPLG